jgi:hypothetical protein
MQANDSPRQRVVSGLGDHALMLVAVPLHVYVCAVVVLDPPPIE